MSKRKKYNELSPEEKQNRRAKAEAESEKAYNQDIRRSKYFMYIMVFMVLAILVGSFIVPRSKSGKGAYFHVSIPVDDVSLDPQKAVNSWEAGVCSLIYEGLVRSDEKLVLGQNLEALNYDVKLEEEISRFNVEPALAVSWLHNASDNSWTFTLRQDVRFHDNNDFTAASVIATFARLLGFEDINVNTDSEFPVRKLFSAIKKVYKIGDYEVVFELSAPDPMFLQKLTLPQAAIISSKHLSREKTANIDLSEKTSGTGPYILQSKMNDDYVFMVANGAYWGDKAYPGVNVFMLGNDNTAFRAIERDELDMIAAGSVLTASLASESNNLSVFNGYSRFFTSLAFNPLAGDKTAQLLANKKLREIVLKACDAQTLLSKNLFEFFDKNQLPRNQGKALSSKDVLEISKSLQTRKFTDSDKLELEFTYPLIQTGYLPGLATLAKTLKQQLAEVNINITLKVLPESIFFRDWLEGRIAFTFADFSDDWFYSFDNFYSCAFKGKKTSLAEDFSEIQNIQDAVNFREELSDASYFKFLGHLLRAHILVETVAGKSPSEIRDFFGLLKTAE